jgi:TRAP-type mannitol/chloroaromatic compound transport system permease large subunit
MTIAVFALSLLGAMALGMPIAFALIICGVALMSTIGMFDSQIVAQNIINGADSFPLMAIPFFMLAGELMNKGGLAKRIVNVALVAVGHLRGGLGYVRHHGSALDQSSRTRLGQPRPSQLVVDAVATKHTHPVRPTRRWLVRSRLR